ncbi:MAG: MATE family efflux transporter [Spirochaetaceae bacterium]|jgi:putative MATE family efflux protein|nr:MATE family efflux transporter [Spirochaetaceae bacterium]
MKKKYTGIELMEQAPVGRAIIRMALPMMAAMIAQSVYNMTDMFFIGQTGDANMVAAVSLVFPVLMLVQALGNVFAAGASSYISRMLGAKNTAEARRANAVSFYAVMAAGFALTLTLVFLKKPVLRLIGASAGTLAHADAYFTVVSFFVTFAAAGTALSAQIRSEGATDRAMLLQLAGITVNIILDPVFILVFRWGTAGAAWATVAGEFVAFLYGVRYFMSGKTALSIRPAECRPSRKMITGILSIGIPAGFTNILMSAAGIVANRLAAGYGDYVVAGSGIQMRITSLCFTLVLALAQGYQPFAGYNYGAKQFARLRKGFKLTALYATALCTASSVLFLFSGNALIRLFINDTATIEAGSAMLRVFVWGLPFIGLQITVMVTFQALGKPLAATVIMMGRQLLFYLPMLFILNGLFGFSGFIWAMPAADILTTGIALALGRSLAALMRAQTA